MPLTHEREVRAVCVTISDVTHARMMQRARDEAAGSSCRNSPIATD